MIRPVILSRPAKTAVGLAILFGGGSTRVSLLGAGPIEAGWVCGRWPPAGVPGAACCGDGARAGALVAPGGGGSGCVWIREPGGGPGGRPPLPGGGIYCGCGGRGTSEGGRCGGLPKILSKILGNCAAAGEAARRPAVVSSAREPMRAISRL